jgi:hypothetical protein
VTVVCWGLDAHSSELAAHGVQFRIYCSALNLFRRKLMDER